VSAVQLFTRPTPAPFHPKVVLPSRGFFIASGIFQRVFAGIDRVKSRMAQFRMSVEAIRDLPIETFELQKRHGFSIGYFPEQPIKPHIFGPNGIAWAHGIQRPASCQCVIADVYQCACNSRYLGREVPPTEETKTLLKMLNICERHQHLSEVDAYRAAIEDNQRVSLLTRMIGESLPRLLLPEIPTDQDPDLAPQLEVNSCGELVVVTPEKSPAGCFAPATFRRWRTTRKACSMPQFAESKRMNEPSFRRKRTSASALAL
jgi:hypothetical protein